MRCCCAAAVLGGGGARLHLFALLPSGAGLGSRGAPPAPTKPSSHGHTANNASGGGAHLVAHTSVRKFGAWGGVCRSTENLSTAAEMGGAARREGERYAPADALPEAPVSAH